MLFTDGVVVRVVAGGDLECAGAELAVHVVVGDDRNQTLAQRQPHLLADERSVALVLGVHGHGGIAQDRLGAGGGHGDKVAAAIRQHIFKEVELAHLLGVFHFQVGDGSLETGRPVDQARAAVDQALLEQAHKGLAHRARQALVQGEALAVPVAGGAQAADLAGDHAAVLLLPGPGAAQKLLAPQFLALEAFFGQLLFHLELGGDAGMVGARHPEGGNALHAVVADHQVFHRNEHGMSQVQFAGHVGRRDRDNERLLVRVVPGLARVVGRLEITLFFPPHSLLVPLPPPGKIIIFPALPNPPSLLPPRLPPRARSHPLTPPNPPPPLFFPASVFSPRALPALAHPSPDTSASPYSS